MRREWATDDLIAWWTLVDADRDLIANNTGATRLGWALMLKFFELDARFPRHPGEVPLAAVQYLAEQVKVDPGLFAAASSRRPSSVKSERPWRAPRERNRRTQPVEKGCLSGVRVQVTIVPGWCWAGKYGLPPCRPCDKDRRRYAWSRKSP